MKFSFKFSNLIGTVYRKGNILFTPDGNSVISPVGNKISVYDLKNNKAFTLPVESRFNYTALDISPNGTILIAVNEEGEAHFISLYSKRIIHKYRFNREVACVKFSPDGKYFAASKANNVFIFKSPGDFSGEFTPFEMVRVFHGANDDVTCIDWSSDSKVLAVGAKDMTIKLYGLSKFQNFQSYSLGGHKTEIVACFFEKDSLDITSISRDGQLSVWECSIDLSSLVSLEPVEKRRKTKKVDSDDEDDIDTSKAEKVEERDADSEDEEEESKTEVEKLFYKRLCKESLSSLVKSRDVQLSAANYHKDTHILVTGFTNGSFFIHELPNVTLIHSLSMTDHDITAICLNNTGDWVALGSTTLGQLLVWEWQSETYVMKQQGHINNMTCLTYSPDGMYIATGGLDGKVKLWNTVTGFCFVTFNEHTAGISSIQFSSNRKFIVSSSLDGTVRAFDMTRYRNFKTFTSPKPVQFSCLALDATGEFVAAGGQDVFEIYLWSMKIGRLCEVLSGHEGPVLSLAFSPLAGSTCLASTSWDKTLRLWNAIETGSAHETIDITGDGLAVVYRPDGEEVAVATLDGHISFFNTKTSEQSGSIEGRNDLGSGVSDTDLISAKKNLQSKAFTSLCYTADGSCILAGGQSKFICIYNIAQSMLLKKFEITQNRSLDSVDDFVNRRKLTEFGNLALIEDRDGERNEVALPGVRRGDMATRATKPEVRVFCLQFSPTGQAWAAVTTEGLMVYSLDLGLVFDPFQLDVGITPDTVKETLRSRDYCKALMMSIKLNEKKLVQYVIESTPPDNIELCVKSLPELYVLRILKYIALIFENTKHLEFYLIWVQHLLTIHGVKLKGPESMPVFLALQKNLTRCFEDLSKICDFNKYTMQFIINMSKNKSELKMDVDQVQNDSNSSYADVEELMSD